MAAQTSESARAELEGPEFPEGLEYIHRVFLDLHQTRTSNGFGANPLSYVEIEAYVRLTGWPLSAGEVEILRHADMHLLALMRERKD